MTAFLVGLPIAVWFLTTSWLLVVLSVFVALILNTMFVFKMIKSVTIQVAEEIAKSAGLGEKALSQMGDLMKNFSNPENSKEMSADFDTMFEGMEGFMDKMQD